MIDSQRINSSERAQAATSGLFGGLAGGMGMALYLTGWSLMAGEGPLAALDRFDPTMQGGVLAGAATHLAISAFYGAPFALLWRAIRPRLPFALPGWAAGLVYGLLLLALALFVLLPAARSPLAEFPAPQFTAAHLVYGAILGALAGRRSRS